MREVSCILFREEIKKSNNYDKKRIIFKKLVNILLSAF